MFLQPTPSECNFVPLAMTSKEIPLKIFFYLVWNGACFFNCCQDITPWAVIANVIIITYVLNCMQVHTGRRHIQRKLSILKTNNNLCEGSGSIFAFACKLHVHLGLVHSVFGCWSFGFNQKQFSQNKDAVIRNTIISQCTSINTEVAWCIANEPEGGKCLVGSWQEWGYC
jgi:hypothetical protein